MNTEQKQHSQPLNQKLYAVRRAPGTEMLSGHYVPDVVSGTSIDSSTHPPT